MNLSQPLSVYYPISLPEIKRKIEKKKVSKRNSIQLSTITDFSNIKEITNNFGETLIRVDGDIPIDLQPESGQRFLFISYHQTRFSHGIHRYPAKFFPELPRWIIKKYSNEYDNVLDPFSGSATTNIEALLLNRYTVGIDIDPFAQLLSKVKTTPLNSDELKATIDEVLKKIVLYNPNKINEKNIPIFPYRDNWFKKEILLELTFIKKIIDELKTSNDIKNFLLITMSSIIRSVSNADDNCTRTVIRKKLNKQVYPSMALTKFAENLLINNIYINEFTNLFPNNTYADFPNHSDARCLNYDNNTFHLAVTSPPYVNAVDYPRTHQLEMYWLGLANGSLSTHKQNHIGTEVVKVTQYKDLNLIGIPIADEKIKLIFKKDPRRAYIAYKFLFDMKKNLVETQRVLKKNGRYVIVIGNNKIRGEVFESWKYLMEIANDVGFKVENYFGSEIIKHFIKVPRGERINTDWVIVLRK